MIRCWNETPDQRPTFIALSKEFEDFLQSNANYLDLESSTVNNPSYLEPKPMSSSLKDLVEEEVEYMLNSNISFYFINIYIYIYIYIPEEYWGYF